MAFVYLIKNGDLFKIGRTENLERRLKQLSPGKLVYAGQTDRSRDLEFELHKRFKSVRIPQTEYFRLNASQVDQVKSALGWDKTQSTQSHGYKNQIHVHNNLREAYIDELADREAYINELAKKASDTMKQHRSTKSQEYNNIISAQNDWYKQQRIERERLRKDLEEEKLNELAQRKYDKWKKKLIEKHEAPRNAKVNESLPKTTDSSINEKEIRIRLAAERAAAIMREHRKSPLDKILHKIWDYCYSIIKTIFEKVFHK